MTPVIRERAFEPFFTTRDVGQGKGLGLSIAWGIVEKHGGSIDVRSEPGEGSVFVVELPSRRGGEEFRVHPLHPCSSVSNPDHQQSPEIIDELNRQAWELRDSDPPGAIERAERALALSSEGAGHPRGIGRSLLLLGHTAMRRGDPSNARRMLDRALASLVACDDRMGEAMALAGKGSIHYYLGEYARAIELHQASLDIHREIGNRSGEAVALGNIGMALSDLGDYPSALEHLRASLEIYRDLGDRNGEANLLGSIGMVHYALGEYRQALEYLHASLPIHQETGNRRGEANTLGNIGNTHDSLGEYADALRYHRAALALQVDLGNQRGEAASLNNIGVVYFTLGEYPQALEHFQASVRINRQIGYPLGEANALGSIGSVHMALDQFPEALEHHRAVLRIHRESGNRGGEANALTNIGNAYTALGEHSLALENHRASLEVVRRIGDRAGEVWALVDIGRTRIALEEYGEALEAFTAAADIAREISTPSLLARALAGIGEAESGLGRAAEAVAALEDALRIAMELGERAIELRAHELISQQHERLGNPTEALAHLRRHLELQKEILGQETRQTIQRLQTSWQIDLARKEAEIERLRNVELKEAFERLEKAHHDLKSAQIQLVQAEKMASLGQLTAGIAHEINNPINFVSSSVRPLRRNIGQLHEAIEEMGGMLASEESARIREEYEIEENISEIGQLLASIEQGATRTAEIVAGLRSFSRLDEGGLKIVDLHEGIDATLPILSVGLGPSIAIERKYGRLPPVECYPGEINQVFMNILSNAVKAIEGEGTVTIHTEAVEGAVRIAIIDTGVGMTPEIQSRIFEPFFTTRDVGEGRGLGLSISWGIVEKHGGTIEVRSAPGEGTTVSITLPIAAKGEG
jgi:signal transduction histidine kinase